MSVETRSTKRIILEYVLATAELPDEDAAEAMSACGIASVEELFRVEIEYIQDLAEKLEITKRSFNILRDVKRWCILYFAKNEMLPSSLQEWQEVFTNVTFNNVLISEINRINLGKMVSREVVTEKEKSADVPKSVEYQSVLTHDDGNSKESSKNSEATSKKDITKYNGVSIKLADFPAFNGKHDAWHHFKN